MNRRLVVTSRQYWWPSSRHRRLPLTGCGDTDLPPVRRDHPFRPPLPVVEYLDLLSRWTLAAITNLDNADLSDAEKQVLARQSFVAVDLPAERGQLEVLDDLRERALPGPTRADHHRFHVERLPRSVRHAAAADGGGWSPLRPGRGDDQRAVQPRVRPVELRAPTTQSRRTRGSTGCTSQLAARFSSRRPLSPPSCIAEVQAELALIEAAAGPAESPIFGYTEDYSQYKPRGHYTRSERLERYFKAMMWYGHPGFFINPREPDVTEEEAASLTRRAILISSSLVGPAREALGRHL